MSTSKNANFNRLIKWVVVLSLAMAVVVTPTAQGSTTTSEMQSYIVQGYGVDQVAGLVLKYGGMVTSHLGIIDGVGALLTHEAATRLLREPGVNAVTPNSLVAESGGKGNVPASDYPNVAGADVVWDQGDIGSGLTVAVVDTGLDWQSGLFKDVDGKAKSRILGWKDFVEQHNQPFDPNGHGTHIAGVIANSQVGEDGEWDGIAPGVSLVGVRVLNEEGIGSYEKVIQGIQWVVKNQKTYNIQVMNLSLVAHVQSPYWADPINQAVMKAWDKGITVVVASGNDGPGAMTVGVPGNNPYVITVGAFTDNYTPLDWSDDYLAPFSAAGPTLDGFVKPDVVAPGAHMVSIMLPSSYISKNHLANRVSAQYFSMAGTSEATAVVSGVAALILAKHPELTPNQVKYRIMQTAFPWVDLTTGVALYSMWQQGAGRVNAVDAVFVDIQGEANSGLDIKADLAGRRHYEGFSSYDQETGEYRLRGDFSDWAGGYGAWSGGYGAWSGGYGAWSGGYGAWSGGYGAWSGGYGAWSGGYGAWSGGYGAWSGGYGAWSGGYGAWSGGYGAWSGSEPWAGSIFAEASFVQKFINGVSPNASTTTTYINKWVEEP
jgi:serine protease AprX